jgi:hypothetical protein
VEHRRLLDGIREWNIDGNAARSGCSGSLSSEQSWRFAGRGCIGDRWKCNEWCAQQPARLIAEQNASRERKWRTGYSATAAASADIGSNLVPECCAVCKLQCELPEGVVQLRWIIVE